MTQREIDKINDALDEYRYLLISGQVLGDDETSRIKTQIETLEWVLTIARQVNFIQISPRFADLLFDVDARLWANLYKKLSENYAHFYF